MKIFYILIFSSLLGSCSRKPDYSMEVYSNDGEEKFKVIVVDGCEYLYSEQGVGSGRTMGFAHKGNCIYCADRARDVDNGCRSNSIFGSKNNQQ